MRKWFFLSVAAFAVCLAGIGYLALAPGARLYRQELCSLAAGKGKERGEAKFRQRLDLLGKEPDALSLELIVKKGSRQLLLLDRDQVLATFPIGLGAQPLGQKVRADDRRTPEGEYYICYKKEESRYHLFMGISFPSPNDASRALGAGLITATEAEAILDAAMARSRPPWNTGLGGPFGIHGYGADSDWTEGTIAMANPHIEELFWNVPLGTPVTVEP